MEHNGTEKVEYGMRAAVESVRLQRACLREVPPGYMNYSYTGFLGTLQHKRIETELHFIIEQNRDTFRG